MSELGGWLEVGGGLRLYIGVRGAGVRAGWRAEHVEGGDGQSPPLARQKARGTDLKLDAINRILSGVFLLYNITLCF